MERLRNRWPLPFNVITSYWIVNLATLINWALLFFYDRPSMHQPLYNTFYTILEHPWQWGVVLGILSLIALLATPSWPLMTVKLGFYLRVVATGLSSAWWILVAILFWNEVGYSTGSAVYSAIAVAGMYELIRTVRVNV